MPGNSAPGPPARPLPPGPRRSAKPEAPPADPTGLLRGGQLSLVVNTREPAALKMSKLSFRARALDASKPMPIYMAEELPDLPDYSAINRAVPQMPSGMEKEEECVSRNRPASRSSMFSPSAILPTALNFVNNRQMAARPSSDTLEN